MNDNLLDCIAHGTTYEDFLASFDNDPYAAARHLRDFYAEQDGIEETDEELDRLQRNTANRLRQLAK